MNKIRTLLAGSLASVLGLSTPQFAEAQAPDDTDIDRSEYTIAQARREVLDRAVHMNYDNWQREVVDYDGAAIILFSTSCSQNDITRNMDVVYLSLMDKLEDAKVNDLPLKFGFYDACGKSRADLLGVSDGLQTHMYLNGKLIDSKVGAPSSEETIPNTIIAGTKWIESNLLGIAYVKNGQDMRVVYHGQTNTILEPF